MKNIVKELATSSISAMFLLLALMVDFLRSCHRYSDADIYLAVLIVAFQIVLNTAILVYLRKITKESSVNLRVFKFALFEWGIPYGVGISTSYIHQSEPFLTDMLFTIAFSTLCGIMVAINYVKNQKI